jgi:hypothetical protein
MGEVNELRNAIKHLENAQQQRHKDLESVKNGLMQYLNVVFVALGVLYGAVLQGSNVKCNLIWSPVLLTTALVCLCCWVTWNKMHYIEQRQHRINWRAFQLQKHMERLRDLQQAPPVLSPTVLPQDPGHRENVSQAAVAAVFGLLMLLLVLVASYAHAVCFS